MSARCAAITKAGTRCQGPAIRDGFCFSHAPDLADARARGRADGGRGKSFASRARKAIPADLRDISDGLLEAFRDVQTEKITPGQAAALSGLARAYVAVYEAGLVQTEIAELRAAMAGRDAVKVAS